MTRIWPETASRKPIAPRRTTTVATTTVKPVLRDSEEEYMEDNEAFYPPETPKPATLPPAINYRSTRRPRLSITEAEEDPEEDA